MKNLKHTTPNTYLVFLLILTQLTPYIIFGQDISSKYDLLFTSGKIQPNEETSRAQFKTGVIVYNTKVYKIFQFKDIPTERQKQALLSSGIHLLQYIPNYAYYTSIESGVNINTSTLDQYGIRAILDISPIYKIKPNLLGTEIPTYAIKEIGTVDLRVSLFPNISEYDAKIELAKLGILQNSENGNLVFRVKIDKILALASIGFVSYIEPIQPPDQFENYTHRANHRSNALDANYNGGLKYTGAGVTVAEGDQGAIFQHVDFTGRLTVRTTSEINDHSTPVAGTIGGAGNLDPKMKGQAMGVNILSYTQYNAIAAIPTIYAADGVRVTNQSLGSTCMTDYDSDTRFVDAQVRQYNSLFHNFSAGNSSDNNCGTYPTGWGNVTGGRKLGKNIITVGNVTNVDVLNANSSIGPATDGRIKPDICASGTLVESTISGNSYQLRTGTSNATPAVSGILAQLIEVYRSKNGGADPKTGLLKGILLNSAEDLGNEGPDFKYGFGRINALRAYKYLNENRYQTGTLTHGQTNTHTISVPPNTLRLNVMVYWVDVEGTVGVSKALVNDLDVTVKSGTTSFFPYVLNPSRTSTADLNAPATKGPDHLNNMEQVVVDNPSGSYTIEVVGGLVPQGPQEYFLVYEYLSDDITVTYPIGGEGFVAGEKELIRWDAYVKTGTLTLEYSTNEGATWNAITSLAGTTRYYQWTVPSTVTGKALIRVSRNNKSDVSDANFSIIGVPSNLTVNYICTNTYRISWNAVSGAESYTVYQLGSKYMDSIGTTINLNFILPTSSGKTEYYSVCANIAGVKGRRAIAKTKTGSPFGCVSNQPPTVSITTPTNGTTFTAPASVPINANASDSDGNITKVEFFNGSDKLGEDLISPYSFSWLNVAIGSYTLTVKATDNGGLQTTSSPIIISVVSNQLPITSITSPTNGTNFNAPASITINANASDPDGNITKVEFFNAGNKLGEDLTSPYSFSWTDVAMGSYSLTTKATDDQGGENISPSISITVTNNTNCSASGTIVREVWSNISGNEVSTIPVNQVPTSTSNLTSFKGPNNVADNYGSRIRGYICVPTTGSYTFWIASDNNSELYLSSDVNPANKVMISYVIGSTGSLNFNTFPSQRSALIPLVAGKSYYIEALHKESTGPDHVAVGWQLPNGTLERPIPGNRLSPFSGTPVNTPPVVSITSPLSGATFTAPASITINSNASDSDGNISKVEFFNGTDKLGEDLSSPYSFTWSNVLVGSYSLTAKTTDNGGLQTTSSPVTISVVLNQLPTVSITSPSNGANFNAPANITINANASDPDGNITKVEFFDGANKLGEDLLSPYSFSWIDVVAGSYSLTVKATDNSGGETISSPTTISVSSNQLPLVSITSPINGTTFTAPASIIINVNATDNGEITKVEFFNGASKLGEDISTPYSFSWSNVIAGSYAITAKATDNEGGVTISSPISISVTDNTNCSASGTMVREVWSNISGNEVTLIPVNHPPTSTSNVTSFRGPNNVADNYGARIRGYICVPTTGNYTFWIASDNNSELYISSDTNPANKVRIAYVIGSTGSLNFNTYPSQRSTLIPLVAGKSYYIEALHKESIGPDHVAVGWQLPSGTLERPIPGNRLSPYIVSEISESITLSEEARKEEVIAVNVFPNPSEKGAMTLTIEGYHGIKYKVAIDVLTLQGISVYSNEISCDITCPRTIVNIDEKFQKGAYMVNVRIDGKIYSQKLLIE